MSDAKASGNRMIAAIFIAGAVVLFLAWPGSPALRIASEQWDMLTICKGNLQSDVEAWLPERDPQVLKCSGRPRSALCFVDLLDQGQRRTRPVTWDCSRRWVPADWVKDLSNSDPEAFSSKHAGQRLESFQDKVFALNAALVDRR